MPRVYLSLGSNIDRDFHIRGALDDLQSQFGEITRSNIYEAEPVGFDGPPFYNLVVAFDTDLPAPTVADALRRIEIEHGRTGQAQRFAPRQLDIDLLMYGDEILQLGHRQLPRDDILRYAFVLEPLAEIAGALVHPVTGQTMAQLWSEFDKTSVRQHRLPLWNPLPY